MRTRIVAVFLGSVACPILGALVLRTVLGPMAFRDLAWFAVGYVSGALAVFLIVRFVSPKER
jgi:hypothetical protein